MPSLMKNTDKLKIMFVIDFFYGLKNGGTENQFFKLVTGLDRVKYDVHLLILRNTAWLSDNAGQLNCTVKTFNFNSLRNPRNIAYFISMVRHINAIRPDIVITFFPLSNIVGVLASRLAGIRNIFSTRRDYGLWVNWLFRGDIFFLRFANKYVNKIIANAYCIKEIIHDQEKTDRSKLHVIYNGIDIRDFQVHRQDYRYLKEEIGIPSKCQVVGLVSNLSPMKRHATFLKAAKRVLRDKQDIHFVLVGDGRLRAELETLTADMAIQDRVHFVGSQERVLQYLSIMDIGVNCSANEGLSNAVMEYMACGIPCVVSNAGGNPELIKHGVNGYLFKLDDDEALAILILDLIRNDKIRDDFISNSKNIIAERFSTAEMISNYDDIFSRSMAISQKGNE